MSVSVVIVKDDSADEEKIKNFWTPVKLKYNGRPEVEFIFTNDMEDGIRRAQYVAVFITPWNMVPTYQTLITMEALKPNQCLMPTVHGEPGVSSDAFSINKKAYNGEKSEWIANDGVEVINNITMYRV